MSRFRLAAVDLDGTLLNREKHVSPGNRAAVAEARAQGLDVIVASGRSLYEAAMFAREAGCVRAAADFIAPDNNADGVAAALHHFLTK